MLVNFNFHKYRIWKREELTNTSTVHATSSVSRRVFILVEFRPFRRKCLKRSSQKYWARIEQKNSVKFDLIQPTTTSGDLHVARASARCEINANVLLWSNYFIKFVVACSRPSVSGSVRRAAGERGKNEEGLGRPRVFPEPPRSRSLTLNRLIFRSLLFSFASTNWEPGTD